MSLRNGWSRVVWPVASSLVLAAACSQAGDSVTAGERVTTDGSSSALSAPPRQETTTLTSLVESTTSPTVASTVEAPPTSGGTGEGVVTSVSVAPSDETLPTVVPTSAPDIATTAPTVAAPSTAAPPPAGTVTILRVTCGAHPEGDWVVFHLSAGGLTPTVAYGPSPVAVAGDSSLMVNFSPATDATSGRLTNPACRFVKEVAIAANADGTVTWAIGVAGQPGVQTVGPQEVDGGQLSYVVKLLG